MSFEVSRHVNRSSSLTASSVEGRLGGRQNEPGLKAGQRVHRTKQSVGKRSEMVTHMNGQSMVWSEHNETQLPLHWTTISRELGTVAVRVSALMAFICPQAYFSPEHLNSMSIYDVPLRATASQAM